jgi:chaperonin GroEL
MIAKALEQAGKDGHVLVRDSNTTDTQLVQTNGYYFDRGYLSPHFVSKYNQNEIEFEDPLILITENKIEDINDIRNALQIAAPILNDHKQLTKSGRPLVVVAEDVVGDALAFMVRNHLGGFVNCVAIKAPGIRNSKKEYLEDMAILTGATMISKEKGRALHKAKEEHLGTCKRIIINKEYTTIIGAVDALPFEDMKVTREAKIQERCQLIRTRLERATDMERPSLAERLARLTGGISLLYVGGNSDIEVKEKKDRIDDAIRATKCAFEDGVILGGGLSLLEISRVLASNMEVDEHGNIMPIYSNFISALIEVLQTPFETILKNGHIAPESVNLEEYAEELRNDLIYDPVKVVKKSIENSFSIAALFLNTDVVIAPKSIDTETAILDMAEQAKVRF